MSLRLAVQPFWVRALVYGVSFGVLLGLFSLSDGSRTVLSALVSTLFTGVAFGVAMAFMGQSVYTGMNEAVVELDTAGRSKVFAAVNDGAVPADSAVRYSAIRFGKAYLRQKTDAQLKRQEWISWLLIPLFVGMAIVGAATISANRYEAGVFLVCGLVFAVRAPRGIMRQRKIQRNVALLTQGADSNH